MVLGRCVTLLLLLLLAFQGAAAAAAEPGLLLSRAIAMGNGPAVESFVAQYPVDLNLPLPLHNGLSLRPLSIALTRIQANTQRQLLPHVEREGYLPEYETQMLERLLRLDADPVYQEDRLQAKTPLHLALDLPEKQQLDVLRLLLQFKAEGNLSLQDQQGLTPAAYAAQKQVAAAQWLSNYKASGLSDFNIRHAPFVYARGQKALERFAREEALIAAAFDQDLPAFQSALEALKQAAESPDVYLLEPVGRPLLHQVALNGSAEILTQLHRAGVRISITDFDGRQVMHFLAAQGRPNQIHHLTALAPVTLNARDREGNTPLFYALRAGQADNVTALIKGGANPALRNYAGLSPRELLQQELPNHPGLAGCFSLLESQSN
ncbi:MAG: ankyrin repeat domain-containing protein [Candidatus Sericytochromatia bacterium]|nr:ankyrin repeat domain-containing protein [Candidatus Sericytochromatia bacterium]